MDYSQRLRRLETEKDMDLTTLRHTGGTPFSEHHQIDPREGRYEKRRIRNSSHSSNNGTSYMNWRSWSCVNIRRMSACSKTWLNQARTAEGSREPRNSRQSSGVFWSTHLHWKSTTSGNVICVLPCLTRIESGLPSNNIGALAAFNPALLLVTNWTSVNIFATAWSAKQLTLTRCFALHAKCTVYEALPGSRD